MHQRPNLLLLLRDMVLRVLEGVFLDDKLGHPLGELLNGERLIFLGLCAEGLDRESVVELRLRQGNKAADLQQLIGRVICEELSSLPLLLLSAHEAENDEWEVEVRDAGQRVADVAQLAEIDFEGHAE